MLLGNTRTKALWLLTQNPNFSWILTPYIPRFLAARGREKLDNHCPREKDKPGGKEPSSHTDFWLGLVEFGARIWRGCGRFFLLKFWQNFPWFSLCLVLNFQLIYIGKRWSTIHQNFGPKMCKIALLAPCLAGHDRLGRDETKWWMPTHCELSKERCHPPIRPRVTFSIKSH